MKYAVITFGCRVNQADSTAIERELRFAGATAAAAEEADLVIVNTCSVTASADQGARQTIRRIARSNPNVHVVVTGCYATRRPEELRDLQNVVRVVSNDEKDDLGQTIAAWYGLTTAERFAGGDGPCGEPLEPGSAGRTALTMRVQTGCDEPCTYCIIPQTRGTGRSRPLALVTRDIEHAAAAGFKEIAITGVHLGSYGRDLSDGSSLPALMRTLAAWRDDVLFRISSLEPMDCTDEIVMLVSESDRLAPHFHLPLQHASDAMLRAMKRPYTFSYYSALLDRIRSAVPDASIGSDLIVGFPGETAEDFTKMQTALERLPLTYAHVFPYSDRPGTAAAALRQKIDGTQVRARSRQLRAIAAAKATAFTSSQAGYARRALVVDDGWSAVTDNYLKVRLDRQQRRNEWALVRIERGDPLPATVLQ